MSRRHIISTALALCLSAGLLTATAQPGHTRPFFQPGSFDFGLQLGGLFFLDNEAIPFDPEGDGYPDLLKDTFVYTAHIGYNFTQHIGLEFAAGFSPAESNRMSDLGLHLNLIYHPIVHDWIIPFIGVGPSVSFLFPQKDFATDIDPGANAVIGVKMMPWDHVGIRADVRYIARIATADAAEDGREEVMGHDLAASIGLFGTFGNAVEEEDPVPLDTDGDGIIDEEDACPTVFGHASAQGCPDRDGDGIPDDEDRCPDDAGPKEFQGCPDRDGDGIPDIDDRCPNEAGPKKFEGCPDQDGDGIPDIDDRCPTIAGLAEFDGCPPPPPEEVVAKFTGKIEGITFEVDSATIRTRSYPTLDEAVEVMNAYPQVTLVIEGHTSSEGAYEYNVNLSQARADAVKQYFIDKGIDADRLSTKGYGPDQPIASNDNERGRAQNRRIEFKLNQPE